MAFGFPAYYTQKYKGSSDKSVRDLLDKVFKELNLSIKYETNDEIAVKENMNFWSWGETIYIQFSNSNSFKITSRCNFPLQCIDWGKNKENVQKIVERLSKVEKVRLQISASDFKKNIKKGYLLFENEIITENDLQKKKEQLISELSKKNLKEDANEFLSELIPLKKQGVLSEEDISLIKSTI